MPRQRRTRRRSLRSRRSRNRVRRSSFRRRRTHRRRLNSAARLRRTSNLGFLLPKRVRNSTVYVSPKESLGAAGYYERVWCGTGLFDVDPTVGGHQPMLFDQLMALYDRYFVYGSSIEVYLSPTQSTQTVVNGWTYIKAMKTTTNITASLSFSSMKEQPGIQKYPWSFYTGSAVHRSGYLPTKALYQDWSRNNPDSIGSVSFNPTNNVYWHVVMSAPDEASAWTGQVFYRIKFWVEYFNYDDLIPQS